MVTRIQGVDRDPMDGLVPIGLREGEPEVEDLRSLGDVPDGRLVRQLEGSGPGLSFRGWETRWPEEEQGQGEPTNLTIQRPLIVHVVRVQRPGGLEEQHMNLLVGDRFDQGLDTHRHPCHDKDWVPVCVDFSRTILSCASFDSTSPISSPSSSVLGVGFAALRESSDLWDSGVFTVTLGYPADLDLARRPPLGIKTSVLARIRSVRLGIRGAHPGSVDRIQADHDQGAGFP